MFELPGRFRVPVIMAEQAQRFVKSTIGTVAFISMAGLWSFSSQASEPADIEVLLDTGSCQDCDLSGVNLSEIAGGNDDFQNANLSGANLYLANLDRAGLSGADLNGAILFRASLNGTDLSNASFLNANLTDATLLLADTTNALTDSSTTCPDGTAGPCDFLESN